MFTAPTTETDVVVSCTVDAIDSSGNETTDTFTVNVTGVVITKVAISGRVTFDSVPHNTSTNGLNYGGTVRLPTRGVTVQAINGSGTVLDSDTTNANGRYTVEVDTNTNVRIRVLSEMVSTTGAIWDVKTTDNTNANQVYAIQGSLATSGGDPTQTRNLNAASGWGTSSYTGARAAAPFAILNPIYDALMKIIAVDPAMAFRAMSTFSETKTAIRMNMTLMSSSTNGVIISKTVCRVLTPSADLTPHQIVSILGSLSVKVGATPCPE